jgi:TonB-dependent receptor
VNLTWNPQTNVLARISFAETVARPTYREFAAYRSYDPYGDEIVQGNPNLVMSAIRNYDLRLDWFTTGGGLLSVGAFYKTVTNPIEKYNADIGSDGEPVFTSGDFVTFLNSEEATVWGFEIETRQNLGVVSPVLDAFSAGFNFAWINSEVPLEEGLRESKALAIANVPDTRPLYDQSPYIINADITYDSVRSGTSVTVIFGYAAERLALINSGNHDIYEQGAPILDLVISQRLGKHWKLKFSADNLLNPEVTRAYNVDDPADATYLYSSYTRGVTFGLSIGCEF